MLNHEERSNEHTALKPLSSTVNYSDKTTYQDNIVPREDKRKCFCILPKRYIVAMMMFFGCANMGILRSELSVPIVGMTHNTTALVNGSYVVKEAEYHWDSKQQGLLLSSFFFGYVITQIPGGFLSHRFGGKIVFGLGIFSTGIFSLLSPICATNVYLFMTVRFFQGFCLGVCFPAIYGIMKHWVTEKERSKLMTTSIAGKEFGIIVCLGLSGVLTARLGWQSVFYTYGLLALLWVFLWWLLVSETPSQHPWISPAELHYLENNIDLVEANTHFRPPYFKIFTSPAVISIVILDLCTYWCYYLMLTTLPTYLQDIYSFKLEKTGWLSSVPYFVLFASGIFSGQVADLVISREYLSITKTRKFFSILCCIGMNSFLIGSTYAKTYIVGLILLNISFAFLGMSYPTFPVNALDVAPQYASLIMGVSNCLTVMSGIISPTLAGYIVLEKSTEEWRIVFSIATGVNVFGTIIYSIFGSGERQPWACIDVYSQHINDDSGGEKSLCETKATVY